MLKAGVNEIAGVQNLLCATGPYLMAGVLEWLAIPLFHEGSGGRLEQERGRAHGALSYCSGSGEL